MWRLVFPVAGPLDDYLVAGIGQAVESAVAQDEVVEEAEPLLHRPVAGDYEGGDPVSAHDQLVEVGGLLGVSRWRPRSSRMSRSGVRRMVMGSYHQVSEKHPQRYIDELVWRHDTHRLTVEERMQSITRNMRGRRLTLRELRAGGRSAMIRMNRLERVAPEQLGL